MNDTLKPISSLLRQEAIITADYLVKKASIKARIREIMINLRKKNKLSIRQLAKRLKISAPYLSDMELGNRDYSLKWCEKVIKELYE